MDVKKEKERHISFIQYKRKNSTLKEEPEEAFKTWEALVVLWALFMRALLGGVELAEQGKFPDCQEFHVLPQSQNTMCWYTFQTCL